LRLFAEDLSASQVVRLMGFSPTTVNQYYRRLREKMARDCEAGERLAGTLEADESYFGAKRVRGKRGRGAGGKIIVFGIYKRNGKVRTRILADCGKANIQAALRELAHGGSDIHTDQFGSYDGLVGLGYRRHFRVRHSAGEYARGGNHINGIESFWGFCKRRLAKFNGIRADAFYLHLKECEFRFNHRKNLYQKLRQICGV
jgi:transposase-like protein